MKRISSRTTYFHKKVFPFFWFGFLAIFAGAVIWSSICQTGAQRPPLGMLFFPIFMAGFGYFIFRKLIFGLADEVYDCGDSLLVKMNGREERILFSNIRNVSHTVMLNPPRVTISLRQPGLFGKEVSFTPPMRLSFNPFWKSPIIEELIDRIDQARRI